MGVGQVINMDIVADGGTVGCGIVGSEDFLMRIITQGSTQCQGN